MTSAALDYAYVIRPSVQVFRFANAVNHGKKKMKMRGALLGAAFALALPTAAMAQTEGFYVGAGAGVNWTRDADVRDYPTTNFGLKESFDLGGVGSVSAGYASDFGMRAELEFAWRWRNAVDGTESATPALQGLSGKTSSIAFMGNALYDVKTGTPFTPYIGLGAGVAQVRQKLNGVSDKDWVFAYQGIVGASYAVTDNLAVTLDYRYFATLDPEFDLGPVTSKGEYRNHTILAGLRYSFGGPARPTPAVATAPAAPMVQQQPQTEYQVFFDWDKATITPVSDKIIGDAAAAAGRVRAVSIHVVGHTDSSGSPAYNQRLSLRRAEAVQRALVAKGTPANLISIEGKGEQQLMVSTGPNVREPSNRRAQIMIRVQ
ncbi:Outer membrane protein OmpA [Azospirillum lipoferum]|nr:Outer membrane protein OmpA [Azospirillum lipoferum]